MEIKRERTTFTTGEGLEPLEPIDLNKISDFDEALAAMEKTSFSGRQLGEAAGILTDVFTDPNDFTVLTLSGAMSVAKQGLIFCELIDRGYVDAIVSTGALVTHGLTEGMKGTHFKAPKKDDTTLYEEGMCRVYDTVELEVSFEHTQKTIAKYYERLIPALDGKTPPTGSAEFFRRLGELLTELYPQQRGLLASAYRANIPLYVPAFTDSELSLDILMKALRSSDNFMKKPFTDMIVPPFNTFVDVFDFARRVYNHKGSLSIFTIGGGVPRNWGQQITPFFDIMYLEGLPVEPKKYSRGVRICPEPDHWGGLSGCSYREGISWAKFVPESEGGRYAEVRDDATSVLAFLIKGVIQRIEKRAR
ncbi:MAG TPA: deoxyhypusine synthase [candidate division Zixibacteria bacterium]|nr:deoxyhypusine synthase [candidate division Zixibacteria bacterium]HBZ00744.1 deoxyhypusine synthase [candidate division Zixibacteria bacterium]